MPIVRPATLDDSAAIEAIDLWKQATRETIASGQCHVAGDDEGRVLAYGLLNRSFFSRAWIAILFVAEDHRRHGYGDALLDHMESICASPRIWTSTELPNLAMQSLLKKRSYQLTGVVENLQKNPELFYFKDLKKAE
jgi:GNAT superfamily N-acetyltransferase